MVKYRKNRVDASFTEEVAQILREIKDPRVSGVMITVMKSDVSADLKFAKVYYSVLGECDDKELAKGLKSAAPFIRSQIAQRLNLRITPKITFVRDEGVKHGAEIERILKGLRPEMEEFEKREREQLESQESEDENE